MTEDRKPFHRIDDDSFECALGRHERELIASMALQLRVLLDPAAAANDILGSGGRFAGTAVDRTDPAVRRLFPDAYNDDADANAFYSMVAHDQLLEQRMDGLQRVVDTAASTKFSRDDLVVWLSSLNAVRLVLGSRLNITDDYYEPEDEQAAALYTAYLYLSWVVDGIVSEL